MKITVVTISFNQAKYLRQCIDSVLNQAYPNIEYIIVDPGSTDGSREIIDSYGDRVIRVYEKDAGPADGLNKGFERGTGDVFYFINSDDYVLLGGFAKVVSQFIAKPDVDVVLAGGLRVNGEGVTECTFYPSKISARLYVNGAVTLFQQGMFFRADLFKRVGGFNVENRTCWDGELLLDFTLNGANFLRSLLKVGAFRVYPESITGSQRFAAQFASDQKRMFHKVYGNERQPNSFTKSIYRIKKLLGDPIYCYKRCFG
jgi:glycosyltransferase involved in cell wall biosynthesis